MVTRSPAGVPLLLLLALSLSFPQVGGAEERETVQTVEIEAINALSRGEEIDEWQLSGLGRVELDYQSRGSRWVRSRLSIRAELLENPDPEAADLRLTIPRAFIRARFPLGESYLFRATFGKSRVTWGDGALYNAGDLVFGEAGGGADLFSTTGVREETDWLITAFFPLGQFSFFEPLLLVPEGELVGDEGGDGTTEGALLAGAPSIEETAAGGRLQWQLWNLKMEGGYLFSAADNEQDLSFSLQGNIGPDVYGGVATTFPTGGPTPDPREELRITAGAYHQYRYRSSGLLTFRLEALIYPEGIWEESAATALKRPCGLEPPCGVSLYPEVSWVPSEAVTLFTRAVLSPVDGSGVVITGGEWNIYEGLTLGAYVAAQGGGSEDRYSFDRPGGGSLTTRIRYLY
ncbi:MAG: hypothetical protein ACLFP6_05880 [Spirochaetaceae bacterium]